MRGRTLVLTISTTALLAGCGQASGEGQSTATLSLKERRAALARNHALKLVSPTEGETLHGKTLLVEGTATPPDAVVEVELLTPDSDADSKERVLSIDGAWSAEVRVRGREPEKTVIASLVDFPNTSESVTIKAPDAKRESDRRAAKARKARYRRASKLRSALLAGKGVIGLTTAAVKKELGKADHTQEVGGEVYWYYANGDNEYQLVIVGGRVTQVNKY